MKKQLIALSLVAASGLMGQSAEMPAKVTNGSYDPCNDPYCIEKDCYTPQYYDLQCDCGVFIDAEFLYWYAKENRLPLATQVAIVEVPVGSVLENVLKPVSQKYMNDKWEPGFRVGLGMNSECDGWDLYLHYTYMRNTKKRSLSASASDDFGLTSPWINPALILNFPALLTGVDSVSSKWQLSYNVIDLELGRKYWLSECFNLRPFAALRGAWDEVKFDSNTTFGNCETAGDFLTEMRYKNKWWGVGIVGGLQPTWHFSPCFALYGQSSIALLWGDFCGNRRDLFRTVPVIITNGLGLSDEDLPGVSSSADNDFSGMQAMLDLGLGIRFEDTYCCYRYRFTLDLGWEHHLLWNHVHRFVLAGFADSDIDTFTSVKELDTDLGLGGFVLRARFDF